MRLTRLSIQNFRNFEAINVALAGNVVLLGENRVGKSNLLFAIRLVLDPTLPDAARQLKLSDFWDGCDLAQSPQIEVHLDFAEFDADDAQSALLTDFRIAGDPRIARLSYVFRKKPEVAGPPQSDADYEFVVFGGGDEARAIPSRLPRRTATSMGVEKGAWTPDRPNQRRHEHQVASHMRQQRPQTEPVSHRRSGQRLHRGSGLVEQLAGCRLASRGPRL